MQSLLSSGAVALPTQGCYLAAPQVPQVPIFLRFEDGVYCLDEHMGLLCFPLRCQCPLYWQSHYAWCLCPRPTT